MNKYSFEFKKKVVEEYLEGNTSYSQILKKYKLTTNSTLRRWINIYKQYGVEGLKSSRKNYRYSVDFKLRAVTMYETTDMSYKEVANAINLKHQSTLDGWVKIYREKGIDGLSGNKRRPSMSKKSNNKKNKENITDIKEANKRIRELEEELELLQIKNEYLELLRSLRLEKQMETKQESSSSSEKEDIN